ncbi:RNA 2',3'-cyclic phosphodiesterase [Virgibacillus natechei]
MAPDPHYFIAIPLQTSLKEYFAKWQDELKNVLSYKQWPHYEDLHITLKFLGAIDDSKVQRLKEELKIIEHMQTFSIDVGELGTFGNPQKPRVIWAGVEKTESLAGLQQKVEACTSNVGFAEEYRAYHPHITLAKKWADESSTISLDQIKEGYTNTQTMVVEAVALYQIHPGRSVKYETIANVDLRRGQ